MEGVQKYIPSTEEKALALVERIKNLNITSAAECSAAADLAREIRAHRQAWDREELPAVKRTAEVAREQKAKYDRVDKPLKSAEALLKGFIWTYKTAAKKIAEQTIASTSRAAEAALKTGGRTVEQATTEAIVRRQEEIAVAEAAGDVLKVNRLNAMPIDVEAVVAETPIIATSSELIAAVATEPGMSIGDDWDFEVVDESLVPEHFWYRQLNDKMIKAQVKVTKGATKIPGVRVFPKPRVSIR